MRFLVDECVDPTLTWWLRQEGHDVCPVFEEARGATDDVLVFKGAREHRILVTNDKDIGEQVFREGSPHRGTVLLWLQDERPMNPVGEKDPPSSAGVCRAVDEGVHGRHQGWRVVRRKLSG